MLVRDYIGIISYQDASTSSTHRKYIQNPVNINLLVVQQSTSAPSNGTIVPASFSPLVRNLCKPLSCCVEEILQIHIFSLPPEHVETKLCQLTKLSPSAASFGAQHIDVYYYFPIDISSLVNVTAKGSYFNPKVVLKISDSFLKSIFTTFPRNRATNIFYVNLT